MCMIVVAQKEQANFYCISQNTYLIEYEDFLCRTLFGTCVVHVVALQGISKKKEKIIVVSSFFYFYQ